jgi:hypothetical protein
MSSKSAMSGVDRAPGREVPGETKIKGQATLTSGTGKRPSKFNVPFGSWCRDGTLWRGVVL